MPRKFSFLSPGVEINEIDESFIEPIPQDDGVMIIGMAEKGPGLEPVRVKSKADFQNLFGSAANNAQGSDSDDVWRKGSKSATKYALVAAEKHFDSGVGTPVNFVRLVGEKDPSISNDAYSAGWNLGEAGNCSTTHSDNITAYGLWVMTETTTTDESSGDITNANSVTGSLAAIFYVSGAAIHLTGTISQIAGRDASGELLANKHVGVPRLCSDYNKYTISIVDETGALISPAIVTHFKNRENVNQSFNTNPEQLRASTNFGTTNKKYFVGETFELQTGKFTTASGVGSQAGILFPLQTASGLNWADRKKDAKYSETTFFISQGSEPKKLFKLVSLHKGASFQNQYYPTIENLTLGTNKDDPSAFDVVIRELSGLKDGEDGAAVFRARCTLDPSRSDFIGKQLGNQYQQWVAAENKYKIKGTYPVTNEYVRVELASDVANNTLNDPVALPVGFFGPAKPKTIKINSVANGTGTISSNAFIINPNSVPTGHNIAASGGMKGLNRFTLNWPTLNLTTDTTAYPTKNKNTFMGVDHRLSANQGKISPCYYDTIRALPGNNTLNLDEHASALNSFLTASFTFTMDKITVANNAAYFDPDGSGTALGTLFGTHNIKRYRAFFHGGFDGIDIKNSAPFSNAILSGKTAQTSYAYNSIQKAIKTISDREIVKYDLLVTPGLTNTGLTNELISLANSRKDFLYLMDLPNIFLPGYENGGTETEGTLSTIVSTFKTRRVDSSYVATYYPWVKYDFNSNLIPVPPSVAALEAISKSEKQSFPWFAPAGFNRGTITAQQTTEHLTKANRDDLYQARINPIARFPASNSIVAFGQKTLQVKPSALDRINVRRLLIYLKKRINVIADQILFDQNVNTTWLRFKTQAEAVLNDVKNNLGITEYKLVLDETTTTADLIDRNILYAKIFIKPARAIEFIVVDFVITRSGVEF